MMKLEWMNIKIEYIHMVNIFVFKNVTKAFFCYKQ